LFARLGAECFRFLRIARFPSRFAISVVIRIAFVFLVFLQYFFFFQHRGQFRYHVLLSITLFDLDIIEGGYGLGFGTAFFHFAIQFLQIGRNWWNVDIRSLERRFSLTRLFFLLTQSLLLFSLSFGSCGRRSRRATGHWRSTARRTA